jgi:hypothetical protein
VTWGDHFAFGLAACALAALDPLILWSAGHFPFHYDVPGWALVAIWLLAVDIMVGSRRAS